MIPTKKVDGGYRYTPQYKAFVVDTYFALPESGGHRTKFIEEQGIAASLPHTWRQQALDAAKLKKVEGDLFTGKPAPLISENLRKTLEDLQRVAELSEMLPDIAEWAHALAKSLDEAVELLRGK